MDAMALLCTLHADGPATLKRLRQAGCDSIEAVGKLAADDLAEMLGTTPAVARRFLREAAHLCTRLDTGFLEREEKSGESRAAELALADAPAAPAAPAARAPRAEAPPARGKLATLGYRDQRIVEQVLQAWRKQDAEEVSRAQARPQASQDPHVPACTSTEVGPRAAHEAGVADDGTAEAARAVHPEDGREGAASTTRSAIGGAPASVDSAASTPIAATVSMQGALTADLFPGAVDGLDQETCLRLRQAGVRDVVTLARIDPLALSKSLGVGYMRLVRVSTLARRRVADEAGRARTRFQREVETARSSPASSSVAQATSEHKFSRAGHPPIGVLPPLAQELEVHVGPKSVLPSKTRWSSASAASIDSHDAAGPFA